MHIRDCAQKTPGKLVAVGLLLVAMTSGQAQQRSVPQKTQQAPIGVQAPTLQPEAVPNARETEEVVHMSPFVVTADSDVGYQASETLAGTGLNTKLSDLGAAISVITAKYLQDSGAINLKEVLLNQAAMEPIGFGGNLSGAAPVLAGPTGEPFANLSNAQTATRVRGLANADFSLDYFRSVVPTDNYNIERVEINRGANALFFGVGSPAGIINTSRKLVDFHRTFGSVELRGGSYGSARASLDANVNILKDQLAIRVDSVTDREKYQQKYAYNNSQRYYVTLGWDIKALRNRGLLTSTTINASFERGRIASNNPRVLTPDDSLASWFTDTLPNSLKALGAVPQVTYDCGQAPIGIFSAANHNSTIGTANPINRGPTLVFQGPYATNPQDNISPDSAGNPVLGRAFVSSNYYFPWTGLVGTAQAAGSRELWRVRTDYSLPDQGYYASENLTDPTVFDFFNNLLEGPNAEAISHLEIKDVSLQQLFAHGRAGVELAFDRKKWTESYQSVLTAAAPIIMIDVNTKMWTGEQNPNFGRPFTASSGTATYAMNGVEVERVKLFYILDLQKDLSDKAPNWLGKVFGKHTFSLLDQREYLTSNSRQGEMFWTPDTWVNGLNQSRTYQGGKLPFVWVYLGPSLFGKSTDHGANITGLQENLMNLQNQVNGKGVLITRTPSPSASVAIATQAAYKPFSTPITINREDETVDNTTTGSAPLSQRNLGSQAFSLQSNLLWDSIASVVGWRREQSAVRTIQPPQATDGQAHVLVTDPSYSLYNPAIVPQLFGKTLFAWSAVGKTPEKWLRWQPVISALNVYYGSSENFTPPASKTIDCFGNAIAPPGGVTKERGIYLEAFKGRVTFRINLYRTTQTGSLNSTVGSVATTIVSMHAQAYNAVQQGWCPNGGNGWPVGYIPPPQALLDLYQFKLQNGTTSYVNPGVTDTTDYVSKGKEFEAIFRPIRGLSLMLNVVEESAVKSNTGPATQKLLYSTLLSTGQNMAKEWTNTWAYYIPLAAADVPRIGDPADANMFGTTFQRNVLNIFNTAKSSDGAPVQELRKWRVNFAGNYDFQAKPLKGFSVGSGIRWQDKSAIGYPIVSFRADLVTPVPSSGPALASDVRVQDVRHPFFGPSVINYDAWIAYRTKIYKGKIGLKIQLNGSNLFVHDKLLPAFINPDGSIPLWSIVEGRKFALTTTFSF